MSNDIMQKVAEVAPKHYAFLVKTAEEIKDSPFKDEIVEELDALIKSAVDWRGLAGAAGKGMAAIGGAVGAAAAGGIAMALAGDMYDAAKRGITKSRNYKRMMQANPDLKEMPAKNVQNAFSVLHRFNPEFSGDPMVAGSWVKRQASFGEDGFGNINEMKQLIDSRKSLADTRRLPVVPEIKGLGKRDQKPPQTDPATGKKLDAILQQLQMQDADAQQMFNDQSQFFGVPGGGTRTIPMKK